jgi:CheY-like chemotaxis protein
MPLSITTIMGFALLAAIRLSIMKFIRPCVHARSLSPMPCWRYRTGHRFVLMDVRMPRMDGIEATRLIRSSQSVVLRHDIPIVAMTANAMQSDREQCIEAGMNDYVSKPLSPRTLLKVLENWLGVEGPKPEEAAAPEPMSRTVPQPAAEPQLRAVEPFHREDLLERLMGDDRLPGASWEGSLRTSRGRSRPWPRP